MAEPLSSSFTSKDSFPDSAPGMLVPPDANAARDNKGHFTQVFKLAAVRYAAACGKSQRAAAADIGISDGTLADWTRDARPVPAGKDGSAKPCRKRLNPRAAKGPCGSRVGRRSRGSGRGRRGRWN